MVSIGVVFIGEIDYCLCHYVSFISYFNRVVAEIHMERKMKSQKTKNKPSEVKKQQLSSVRVIQRNLVYIVGLPLNLGDEDVISFPVCMSVCGWVLMCGHANVGSLNLHLNLF